MPIDFSRLDNAMKQMGAREELVALPQPEPIKSEIEQKLDKNGTVTVDDLDDIKNIAGLLVVGELILLNLNFQPILDPKIYLELKMKRSLMFVKTA